LIISQNDYHFYAKWSIFFMRTTLDIDDKILQETLNATQATSKKKAVEKALREYLRMKQRQNLLARIGSWTDFNLSLEELERLRNEQ